MHVPYHTTNPSQSCGFRGQRVHAQCNLQTNSQALGTVVKVNIAAFIRLTVNTRLRFDGQRCTSVLLMNADDLPVSAAEDLCVLLFALGMSAINSATWKRPCGGGLQSRLLAWCLEAKSGRQTGKKKKVKRKMYKTPAVNETAYLSAMSVMCKQRPFRAARHTIALFAMQ